MPYITLKDGDYEYIGTLSSTTLDVELGDMLELDHAITLLQQCQEKYKNLPANQKALLTYDEFSGELGIMVTTQIKE